MSQGKFSLAVREDSLRDPNTALTYIQAYRIKPELKLKSLVLFYGPMLHSYRGATCPRAIDSPDRIHAL